MSGRITALVSLAQWLLIAGLASAQESTPVDIPFEKFTLDNGLRVIVHEDRKAPVVGVAVWYHVGSRNEPSGKTGFAHLFEHLMFEGTENYDHEFTEPFERAGAIQQNGTTWFDRTNYFETVPTPALDMALWMESERMGHLLGAVTQEKLDQERAVVRSEKDQGDSQPYGLAGYRILEGLFPPGHPYRHDTIGSMEDLEAATLEDVHDWFNRYYGAANAVLVLAGDISAEQGLQLARRYFGDIEPGPPLTRLQEWVPALEHDVVELMVDDVPHIRTYHNWAVAGRTRHDFALLQIAADILGDGKNSRLYQALILDTGLAVDVSVDLEPHELASIFNITATLAPEATLDDANAIINEELNRLMRLGPGEEELKRARAKFAANLVRGLERVGGFTGKAAVLASGEIYDGRPDFYKTLATWINEAETEEVRQATRRWLAGGRYRLDVVPAPEYAAAAPLLDRGAGLPVVGAIPAVSFPAIERASLRNGIPVVVARRPALPLVDVTVRFDAGYAADASATPGISAFTLAMLEESTASRTALEVEALAEALGAEISTAADLDTSLVNLSALRENLAASIALLAEIVRQPAFVEDELERLRIRWLAGIESEWSDPIGVALRTLPPLLYGDKHAYGIPFTGSGTPESIQELTRVDLTRFYGKWMRPDNATIVVVGDTSLEGVLPLIEEAFGDWRTGRRGHSDKVLSNVPLPEQSRIYLADQPGSLQSLIMGAHLMPPTGAPDNLEITVMDDIFGGGYNARLNQAIRVEKGWAYGAYTWLEDARGQRLWAIYAPVQSERTADTMEQIQRMIEAYQRAKPATPDELERSVKSSINSLPGQFETAAAVMAAMLDNQRFDRPDDYIPALKSRLEALDLEEVRKSARNHLKPSSLTWVVVGDLATIEEDVAAVAKRLGISEIHTLDFHSNHMRTGGD